MFFLYYYYNVLACDVRCKMLFQYLLNICLYIRILMSFSLCTCVKIILCREYARKQIVLSVAGKECFKNHVYNVHAYKQTIHISTNDVKINKYYNT